MLRRMIRRVGALVMMLLASGCSATLAPMVEGGLIKHPSVATGLGLEIQTHLPARSAEGLTFGLRVSHLVQVAPYVDYDRSHWQAEVGYATVPRGFRRWVGFEAFALLGVVRGALGAPDPTPVAGTLGISLGMPIRLTPQRFGDDEILRYTWMLVPFVTAGGAFPIAPGEGQLQIGGGLAFRIHLDSTLVP